MRSIRAMILLLAFVLLTRAVHGQFEGGTYLPMQEDFDRIRLDHLLVIAKLIDEYEDKVGHFPLSDRAGGKPVAVVIASGGQVIADQGRAPVMLDLKSRAAGGKIPNPPEQIERVPAEEFREELEAVLGRAIDLPVDPQTVPVNKPSVYVYTCYLDVFDVSGFLHHEFPFVRKLGDYNYKVAVGSKTNAASGIWNADDLTARPDFKEFFRAPFNSPRFKLQTKIK